MRRSGLVIAVAAALALAAPASAAAPNYIVVSGPGLPRPVVLDNWAENARLLSAIVVAPQAKAWIVSGLRIRPRVHLALFWGWADRPRPRSSSGANQTGWFYPAHRSNPAVFELTLNGAPTARIAPARALRVLRRNGVPLRSNRARRPGG